MIGHGVPGQHPDHRVGQGGAVRRRLIHIQMAEELAHGDGEFLRAHHAAGDRHRVLDPCRVAEAGGKAGFRVGVDRLRRDQAFEGGGKGRQVVGERRRRAQHVRHPAKQRRVMVQHGKHLHAGRQAVDELIQPRHGGGRVRLARDGGLDRRQHVLQQHPATLIAKRARTAGQPCFRDSERLRVGRG